MPFWIALLLVLTTSGCASFHSGGVSVETVLRDSRAIGVELDREPAAVDSLQQPLRDMKVSSPFGRRWRRAHAGVDLRAREGTPIYSAGDGIVVYADDRINGYGLAVIVRHRHGKATLYAHASQLRVNEGDRVTKGQCLAYAGQTGNATGPHLHFEIRDGFKPVDPITTLAQLKKMPAVPPPAVPTPAPVTTPAARALASTPASPAVADEPPDAENVDEDVDEPDSTRPLPSEDLTRIPTSDEE